MMAGQAKATLFDKLVADLELDGLRSDAADSGALGRASLNYYTVPRANRFNEGALRATVLRELNWLLNTTHLGAVRDLSTAPEVATSTLNYGLADLTGRLMTRPGVQARAREMRQAIIAFEPRIGRASLEVEADSSATPPNSISFVIRGDLTVATQAMPVVIRTDVEIDTGAVALRNA
jgi:type VI secretion system protein ImpF